MPREDTQYDYDLNLGSFNLEPSTLAIDLSRLLLFDEDVAANNP